MIEGLDAVIGRAQRLQKAAGADAGREFLIDEFISKGVTPGIAKGLADDALNGHQATVSALLEKAADVAEPWADVSFTHYFNKDVHPGAHQHGGRHPVSIATREEQIAKERGDADHEGPLAEGQYGEKRTPTNTPSEEEAHVTAEEAAETAHNIRVAKNDETITKEEGTPGDLQKQDEGEEPEAEGEEGTGDVLDEEVEPPTSPGEPTTLEPEEPEMLPEEEVPIEEFQRLEERVNELEELLAADTIHAGEMPPGSGGPVENERTYTPPEEQEPAEEIIEEELMEEEDLGLRAAKFEESLSKTRYAQLEKAEQEARQAELIQKSFEDTRFGKGQETVEKMQQVGFAQGTQPSTEELQEDRSEEVEDRSEATKEAGRLPFGVSVRGSGV